MSGTPLDTNLILLPLVDMDDGEEGNGDAVVLDGPGPYDAELHVAFGAVTGTNPVLDVSLEVSLDGGSTWVQTAALRQFSDDDTAAADADRFHFSRPVFIPGVPAPQTPAWSPREPDPVQVRCVTAVGGSVSPTFADCEIWLAQRDTGHTAARVA